MPAPPGLPPPGLWVERHGLPAGGALLASGGPVAPESRYEVLGLTPARVLTWTPGDPGDPLDLLTDFAESGRRAGPDPADGPHPTVVCALAYELGRVIEGFPPNARAARDALPDLWAARYEAMFVWDRAQGRGTLVADTSEAAASLAEALARGGPPPPPLPVASPAPELTRAAYDAALARIAEHIRAGDTYQINFTVRHRARLAPGGVDPSAFHARLWRASPAAFGAYLRLDDERALFSISPERFLRWDASGAVETWPIKGTRPRGASPERDAALLAELLASPKDAAEHVMIVDLQRNDLGRVCTIGSVEVPTLLAATTHPTLHHLVSRVRGVLRPEVSLSALLRATFPGGSITGAPKRRSMQIIEALEHGPRGFYCGAIGHLDADGGGDLNIAIRTATCDGRDLFYASGGGIVAESEPAAEWAELLTKARAFYRACGAEPPE